jgi:hypothetical protein
MSGKIKPQCWKSQPKLANGSVSFKFALNFPSIFRQPHKSLKNRLGLAKIGALLQVNNAAMGNAFHPVGGMHVRSLFSERLD